MAWVSVAYPCLLVRRPARANEFAHATLPTTITHDAAGNLTADENDLSYQYDHENHLIGVRYVGGGANVLLASFVYDAQGRMHYAWRWADTDTDGDADIKHFYYDGSNILAEYDNNNGLLRRYIHGTHGVDERAILLEGDGSLVSSNPNVYNVQPFYYLLQELDTVTGLLADNGTLVESYNYDAYGDPARMVSFRVGDTDRDGDVDDMDTGWIQGQAMAVAGAQEEEGNDWPFYPRTDLNMDGTVDTLDVNIASANWTGNGASLLSLRVSGVGNPYFFTGRRLHFHEDRNVAGLADNHHLQYNRARHYSPLHGRWLQRDPAGYADGMNLYEYVSSRSTVLADPTGRWGADVHEGLTSVWAQLVGMRRAAADEVGAQNIATDGGLLGHGTGFAPIIGDQSRHFNRSFSGRDTRLKHMDKERKWAREACSGRNDNPRKAAKHLGRALHSVQDRWAHGDYSAGPLDTIIPHFSLYDQWSPAVADPENRVNGRPLKRWRAIDPLHLLNDIRIEPEEWAQGDTRRNIGTEQDSRAILNQYVSFIRNNGNCKCKKYFLDRP